MREIFPADAALRERLRALDETPMPVEEFLRLSREPLDAAERDEVLALVAWFTRRYPTPRARLDYARRAWRRWTRLGPQRSG